MIRTRQLIPKSEVFNLINNPKISRIELSRNDNSTLKNPDICAVYVFNHCTRSELHNIMGACKGQLKDFLEGKDKTLLSTVVSMVSHNFLKASQIVALIELEQRTNKNFGISKKIRQICDIK